MNSISSEIFESNKTVKYTEILKFITIVEFHQQIMKYFCEKDKKDTGAIDKIDIVNGFRHCNQEITEEEFHQISILPGVFEIGLYNYEEFVSQYIRIYFHEYL